MGLPESAFTGCNERCTPDEVLVPLRHHFGPIGLDPVGHPRSIVQAHVTIWLPKYRGLVSGFGFFTDGLMFPWGGFGLVYDNPPYGKKEKKKGMEGHGMKAWTQKAFCDGDEVVQLLPVRTSDSSWQNYVLVEGHSLCFIGQRLKHVGVEHGAPFHQALVYRGLRHELFRRAFDSLGKILKL